MIPLTGFKTSGCFKLLIFFLIYLNQSYLSEYVTEPPPSFAGNLTFFASFDDDFYADFSFGDSLFYSTSSWSNRTNYEVLTASNDHVQIHDGEGRFKNALWIDNSYTPVYFFKGKRNIEYLAENWSGTVSFWLRVSPDQDLPEGFSDPIQITASAWNDGALFVDFTDDIPRIFRFAFFPDRQVWDPEHRDWDDVPVDERPMVDLPDHPFQNDQWTHVAFSFQNFNTKEDNGSVSCFIDGEYVGSLENRTQTITWNPDEIAIWLGYNYRGYVDELSIFNRALDLDEIRKLYSLENGISDLLN
jgi:hypothetical protein